MNPANKQAHSSEIPAAVPTGEPVTPAAGQEGSLGVPETGPAGAELAPANGPPAAGPIGTIPIPLPNPLAGGQPQPAANAAAPSTAAGPAINDDDLIEKEWVDKAKSIVERTRDDPYRQSQDLTLVKADYIKKRYGKTIKISQ